MNILKQEIQRLARKEIKVEMDDVRKRAAEQRKTISELRRRIEILEKQNTKLAKRTAAVAAVAAPEVAAREEAKAQSAEDRSGYGPRFSGQAITKLRQKLNLTQAEFAKLAGVSPQSVYQWERKGGKLRLRTATKEALVQMRGMGVREARRLLESN
jgi:DNA-binding transcriptional regulator YiaG